MSNNFTRTRVLQLYKRIIKLSQTWQAIDHPAKTSDERLYIRNEARELFRQNRHVRLRGISNEERIFVFLGR